MKKIQLLRRVWGIASPFRKNFITLVLLIMATHVLSSAVYPIFLGKVVTAITQKDINAFFVILTIWVLLSFLRPLINLFRERMDMNTFDYAFSRHLTNLSMEKFFSISIGQHSLGHSVIKRNVIRKGETGVTGLVNMTMYELIPIALQVGIPLVLLLANVPIVGILVIMVMVLFTVYTIKYNKKALPGIRDLDTLENTIGKRQGEFISNVDVVITNAQEERVKKEFDKDSITRSTRGIAVWIPYIDRFYVGQLLIVSTNVLCTGVAGYLAYTGVISTGMLVTSAMWISMSIGTLSSISHIQRGLARNIEPLAKYFRYLDFEPDIKMPQFPVSMGKLRGDIEFRNVSFTYKTRDGKDNLNDKDDKGEDEDTSKKSEFTALKEVSFKIENGKRYALVGPSGAGKSTIVGLILRAYDPESGNVLIDGVDLRMIDYCELRRNVGLVPQEVALFDGSIRDNVTFGLNGSASSITTEKLEHMARLSRISEFKDKLEKGWDTVIGERGIKLSGGQRQRIGIARALIKEPTILIFDEATSSLDTENEAKIRESILEASQGKTTIIIAHRLATVRDADVIFVMDDGRIVGQGSHDELLKSNEYYQKLVKNQVIMA